MADLQSQIHSKAPIAAPQLLNQTGYNSGYFGQGGAGSSQRDGSSEFLGNLSTTDAAFSGHEDHHNSHPSTENGDEYDEGADRTFKGAAAVGLGPGFVR
jgi:hypothetical protein